MEGSRIAWDRKTTASLPLALLYFPCLPWWRIISARPSPCCHSVPCWQTRSSTHLHIESCVMTHNALKSNNTCVLFPLCPRLCFIPPTSAASSSSTRPNIISIQITVAMATGRKRSLPWWYRWQTMKAWRRAKCSSSEDKWLSQRTLHVCYTCSECQSAALSGTSMARERRIICFRLPVIVHGRHAFFTYCLILVSGLSPLLRFHPVAALPILTLQIHYSCIHTEVPYHHNTITDDTVRSDGTGGSLYLRVLSSPCNWSLPFYTRWRMCRCIQQQRPSLITCQTAVATQHANHNKWQCGEWLCFYVGKMGINSVCSF